jgi:hypothetical protein
MAKGAERNKEEALKLEGRELCVSVFMQECEKLLFCLSMAASTCLLIGLEIHIY